jgi:selenocysteine lyase/cysteine desulfurase
VRGRPIRLPLGADTFVHSASGAKLPLAAIGEMIAKVNEERRPENRILFSVDGVHGLGVENFKVRDLVAIFMSPAATSGCSARAAPE